MRMVQMQRDEIKPEPQKKKNKIIKKCLIWLLFFLIKVIALIIAYFIIAPFKLLIINPVKKLSKLWQKKQ